VEERTQGVIPREAPMQRGSDAEGVGGLEALTALRIAGQGAMNDPDGHAPVNAGRCGRPSALRWSTQPSAFPYTMRLGSPR